MLLFDNLHLFVLFQRVELNIEICELAVIYYRFDSDCGNHLLQLVLSLRLFIPRDNTMVKFILVL